MDKFTKVCLRIEENEGGISNDSADPGGLTIFGITERDWGEEFFWDILRDAIEENSGKVAGIRLSIEDNSRIRARTRTIMREHYYDQIGAREDFVPLRLAYLLTDHAFNAGVARTGRLLQSALNDIADQEFRQVQKKARKRGGTVKRKMPRLVEDGVVGRKTIEMMKSAVKGNRLATLLTVIVAKRFVYYTQLAKQNPALSKYWWHWVQRCQFDPEGGGSS